MIPCIEGLNHAFMKSFRGDFKILQNILCFTILHKKIAILFIEIHVGNVTFKYQAISVCHGNILYF